MAQFLPPPRVIQVDTRGAVILNEESPETRDSTGIYFPNHIEPVSHIALDVGFFFPPSLCVSPPPSPSCISGSPILESFGPSPPSLAPSPQIQPLIRFPFGQASMGDHLHISKITFTQLTGPFFLSFNYRLVAP
ncbi:hypothetical protein FRC19_008720 [Serendipita sp. 401]|nr:hypothetical protein FRC19_008720 [Serendipita sp. 401]